VSRHNRACALGNRCAEAVIDPSDPKGRLAPFGSLSMCYTDRQILDLTLGLYPWLYRLMRTTLGDKARGGQVRAAKAVEPSTPLRMDIEELMARTVRELSTWSEILLVSMSKPISTDPMRPSIVVVRSSEYIRTHLLEFIEMPGYEADGAVELLELSRVARSRLGLTGRDQQLSAPCGVCNMRRLIRWDGTAGLSDSAKCNECGTEYTSAQYAELVRTLSLWKGRG
jgi:hypothetical protein